MTKRNAYYRPIQYLGSKNRVVDTIVSECKKLYTSKEYVVDLFSGSSLVAQSLYKNGMLTIANDVMSFSSDIAACMLNQGREKSSITLIENFIQNIDAVSILTEYTKFLGPFIEEEQVLISKHDILELKNLYQRISQVGNNVAPSPHVEYIRKHEGASAINSVPIFVNYYAGTYFGIKQSLEIDILRNAIEQEWESKQDLWEKNVLLTALYNTCSIIVHSAGKHFAQPMTIDEIDETKITNIRLFENRSFNVIEVFKKCVILITQSTEEEVFNGMSYALNMDICTPMFKDAIADKKISVIYADPPYTAQQYSRFYHIPEVLHSYKYPKLQIYRGKYTQGIYPENKYKSPFCSKTKAKKAFVSIFELAREHDCHLLLSYSESKKEQTGNDRIVTLEDLLQLASEHLPNHCMRKISFNFDYRQLNNKHKIVGDKEDKEILLIFKKL